MASTPPAIREDGPAPMAVSTMVRPTSLDRLRPSISPAWRFVASFGANSSSCSPPISLTMDAVAALAALFFVPAPNNERSIPVLPLTNPAMPPTTAGITDFDSARSSASASDMPDSSAARLTSVNASPRAPPAFSPALTSPPAVVAAAAALALAPIPSAFVATPAARALLASEAA